MSKFANQPPVPSQKGPVQAATPPKPLIVPGPGKRITPTTHTYEGAPAYHFTPKSELFLLAVTNMVGEDTFYESAGSRDSRFVKLVSEVTMEDPTWVAEFGYWLRRSAFMRTASIVLAATYVRTHQVYPELADLGGPSPRSVVANALFRADEPAELLAYWHLTYGRNEPKAIKRGIADAIAGDTRDGRPLYNEFSAVKYDGVGNQWRMGDVLIRTHPKASSARQAALFKFLLDRRFQGAEAKADGRVLPVIAARQRLEAIPMDHRRDYIRSVESVETLRKAGATWEWISGWIPGGLNAEAWEAIIPSMGHMALLRNLRNFDQAGIPNPVAAQIAARLSNPTEVASGMQFPFRYWSAFRSVGSVRWHAALEEALQLSTANIPTFGGRTLVLTDSSGSMSAAISGKSTVARHEVAGIFAGALASKGEDVTLVHFASSAAQLKADRGDAALEVMRRVVAANGEVGHATDISQGLRFFDRHDRIVVFTDEQLFYQPKLPSGVPTYIFNVAGYGQTPFSPQDEVIRLGGFSDASFRLIPMIEAGKGGRWPWEEYTEAEKVELVRSALETTALEE